MNKILARQLRKLGLTIDKAPEDELAWRALIELVDETYNLFDQDRVLLERSLNISSSEMKAEIERNKQMSLQLAEAGKLASIGTMASGIAHELNNPLAGIKGHAELIAATSKEEITGKNLESLQTILRLSDRMADTIKHLLRLSRQPDNVYKTINIYNCITDAFELFERQFSIDSVDVKFCIDSPQIFVNGNPSAVIGIFQNLLANSRDAFVGVKDQREKSISVEIKEEHGNVSICYKDNAGGMPQHVIDRIFDPFFTTKGIDSGTGLGLAISKQVIEEMHGSIVAKSNPPEGSTFVINLPVCEIGADTKVTTLADAVKNSAALIAKRYENTRLNILVIDDELAICAYFKQLLAPHFTVTTTADAKAGMQLAKSELYDLVITDLRMPKYSGQDIAKVTRQYNPQCQIIFISGHIEGGRDSMLQKYQPYMLLEKPLPPGKKIVEMLKECLGMDEEESAQSA